MDDHQRALLERQQQLKRGAAIIEGKQNEFRQDGYTNMLNKYGMKQDNSTAYRYSPEPFVDDMTLTRLYEGNGLFKKIINRPSEEAVKHGVDLSDFGNKDTEKYVKKCMDNLRWEKKFSTAQKWARLYGGSIIVMLCDDGRGLEEPLDTDSVRSIEELAVFERAVVQPDYTSLYQYDFDSSIARPGMLGEPEYYNVFSIYGCFKVHRTRCLVFKNGELPEHTASDLYRFWGIPEYVSIRDALRECITTHHDGSRLLERSVQAIYKMKNLSGMLATADGEDKVVQRLQVIDMARSLLNSIAIDGEGEDYDFKSFSMSGVKDVIDAVCNMLSAVTDIPQTILFGRSPAGMNATGEGDMENYYSMVENIQKDNMKANTRTVIDLILKQGLYEGKIDKIPEYELKFNPLWSMSESEKASVEAQKASTQLTKAQTLEVYMNSNVVDPSEARKKLAEDGDFEVCDVITDEDLGDELDIPDDMFGNTEQVPENNADSTYPAAAVIVVRDGLILCADRNDGQGICGPGGHAEEGETAEETAVREAREEFNITPLNLIPLGETDGSSQLQTMIYVTDEYEGPPEADGTEMSNARWLSLEDLLDKDLMPAFRQSLMLLQNILTLNNPEDTIYSTDGGKGSGNRNHGGRPGKVGGSSGKFGNVTPKAFANAMQKAKDSIDEKDRWRVDVHSDEEYSKTKVYKTSKGSCIAIENDGNIISVCHKEGDPVRGTELLQRAVRNGGDRLDAFGPKLYKFYTKNGFEPVSHTKFDEQYAPEGWKKGRDKPEEIVFYKYTGKQTSMSFEDFINSSEAMDYDSAKAARDKDMEENNG